MAASYPIGPEQRAAHEPPVEPRTVPLRQAAKMLGIGHTLAYEAAARGEIKTLRVGRRVVVPKAWLDEVLGA